LFSQAKSVLGIGFVLAEQSTMAAAEKHFVYVLRSGVDPARHYVGLTADVPARINAHNAGQSIHTADKRPWELVLSIEFKDALLARRFEHYLKSGSGRAFAKRHFADDI
jgi:putative endonuclease